MTGDIQSSIRYATSGRFSGRREESTQPTEFFSDEKRPSPRLTRTPGDPTISFRPMNLRTLITPLQRGDCVFGGRYRLERVLGRGGMGYVWLARDLELHTYRALKFVTGVYEEEAVELDRLRQEAARTQSLTHQNIVRTYDFVRDRRLAALSMEYIDGITFKEYQHCQPSSCFKVTEIREWMEQLFHALAYAHAQGIVHLDLKPANLMITRCGRLKVTDFGISQSLKDPRPRPQTGSPLSGTPAYMSPQQRRGEPSCVEDDIYALGALLYHFLSGRRVPLEGGLSGERLVAQARLETAAPRRGSIPMNWERIIRACLDPVAKRRPRSVVLSLIHI